MFLRAHFENEWHYAKNQEEVLQLISDVFARLQGEGGVGRTYTPGDNAWFHLTEKQLFDADPIGGSNLRVALNRRTGFGALVWFVDDLFPRKGGVYESVWISNNPLPVDFDPRVVSDPGYPLFHDPSSTLPLWEIRSAVEEFCLKASGERPSCIEWVAGEMNGQRCDRPSIVDFVEDPEIDWDGLR